VQDVRPLGAIEVDPVKHTAFKCDLCGGDPECVKICLAEALIYVGKDKVGYSERREALKKLSDRLVLVAGIPNEAATE
jgi:carbon-monoxide dehydrogenase iron sulfur subunit